VEDDRRTDLVVDVRVWGRRLAVELTGELDVATVPRAQLSLDAALADAGEPAGLEIVIDLTAVTFVDARGLAFLAAMARRDLDLRLRVSPQVRRLLEITDLAGELPLD